MAQPKAAIVGAGIVGLAHAWSAAERGFQVTVFERSSIASGASIRNFGMVWPIGQPPGELHETAMLSRARWIRLATEADLWVNPCGSIHLAHRDDEWEVLQQFHEQARALDIPCELLTAEQVHLRTPAANPTGLLGGLFSPTELCVNPREATRSIPAWLGEKYGIEFQFETHIASVESVGGVEAKVRVGTSRGQAFEFDRVVVCCGAELLTLFPDELAASGLKRCKLQMLSVRRAAAGWTLGPHLASGLTLRHYRNFEICPAIESLKSRVSKETPELDRFGIHVMVSQNNHGEIILGDSHEYDTDIEPFDKLLIDDLMLRELQQVFRLPEWTISERWHGIYTKLPDRPVFQATPVPHVHLCTGTSGAGMTMAFGLAERMWNQWLV
ncbi:MAG: TIGR03364 family FAD-dependent oxidoreductase [Planctomycetaceae bacterium]